MAEIVAAGRQGNLLIYTDSSLESVGFVDITDPSQPVGLGTLAVGGEPTSVDVERRYALVAVNTSANFVNVSGLLHVLDLDTLTIVRTLALRGQSDSVAFSPDRRFAAVVIENERDEDLGDGEPPQAPPGTLLVVDTVGPPAEWSLRNISLVGIPDLFPTDPEPEFVDVNAAGEAVITLQENNHIVIADLITGQVLADFSAGTVDLSGIDNNEDDLIDQTAELFCVPREPDAVAWIGSQYFATADEGDLFGGSRGFTIFDRDGTVVYAAGNEVEHRVARHGHYPEDRSENKGSEPESIAVASYSDGEYLFVGSERSNLVLVYRLVQPSFAGAGAPVPVFQQVLPTSVGPEGLLAIPERDLLVAACEVDARDDLIRASITIFAKGEPNYPAIVSTDRKGGSPIPWGALSGLATSTHTAEGSAVPLVHAVYDSIYRRSRIFTLDVSNQPAVLFEETELQDSQGLLLSALVALQLSLPDPGNLDSTDLVEQDGGVNLDLEGVALSSDGTFWVASEGAGNLVNGVSNPASQPFRSPNLLVQVLPNGEIVDVVLLPPALAANQLRFGFEGLTVLPSGALSGVGGQGDQIFVCFQREWGAAGDPAGLVRIGRYDTATGEWGFVHYPLDPVESANGGWVGLSELSFLDGRFWVIERDNQGNADAAVKRLYSFDVAGLTFRDESQVASFDVVTKTLERDLLLEADYAAGGGFVPEKLEGLTGLPDGTVLVVNDNDGVSDNSGETQLLRLPLLGGR